MEITNEYDLNATAPYLMQNASGDISTVDPAKAGKYRYIDRTRTDLRGFEAVIHQAILDGGTFPVEYTDIFKLTKLPEGAPCLWALDMA